MACGNRISRHLLSCREAGFTKAIGAGLKANTQVPTTRPLEAQTCRTRLTLLLPQPCWRPGSANRGASATSTSSTSRFPPRPRVGCVCETVQTAYGALTTGLDLQPGQSLLVRGGTSALGLTTAALATDMGCRVYATSRREAGLELLCSRGAIPLLDDRKVAPRLREAEPSGVHAVLELVGVPTLQDSLAATAVHGTVCFSGMLSDSWTISDFYPMDWIPNGVRLTAYSGQAQDLPAEVLQRILDRIESGDLVLLPVHSYPLADIAQAHEDMALGRHVASSSACRGPRSPGAGRRRRSSRRRRARHGCPRGRARWPRSSRHRSHGARQ